ncbi:PREDICTED: sperm acrosome membrane-associated protein 1 [Calidris pugnax]|uniref:sperm acrosome membrane-associated protein 1 n=1 Tax=Calidris pugnax TaxID=198806 RepID=UPI00071DE1DD|nr:PREDICTED: sperm acrosome membrane-associated protein 1 [Calidris pugnax]
MAGVLALLLALLQASLAEGAAILIDAAVPSKGGPRVVWVLRWVDGGRHLRPQPYRGRGPPPLRQTGHGAAASPQAAAASPQAGRLPSRFPVAASPAAPVIPATSRPLPGGSSASPPIEYGQCTVTCGIGIREVLLTDGCPDHETKCIVGVESCQGPVDCGWGTPISEGLDCMKITCIFMPPENRFKYVWKMLIPNKEAHILPNDSAVLRVCRDTHSGTFECETQEQGSAVASIKYTVYTEAEVQTEQSKKKQTEQPNTMTGPEKSMKKTTDYILIISLVAGIVLLPCVIISMIFMIRYRDAVKSFLKSKFGRDNQEKKPKDETPPPNVE